MSDNPARFDPGAELLVGEDPDSAELFEVGDSRLQGERLIVHFVQVGSIEDAETLRDSLIFVGTEELEELGEGEFWEHELVGLVVLNAAGEPIGTLAEVIDRPGQDLWSIRTPKGDVLFPAARELVVSVDVAAGKIVVNPPEGLFD